MGQYLRNGLERYLRDGFSGALMGLSPQVLRLFIGKSLLMGVESIDIWETTPDMRALHHEADKLTASQKRELAEQLLKDAESSEEKQKDDKKEDFYNPFNTKPVLVNDQVYISDDNVHHEPGLHPTEYKALKLLRKSELSDSFGLFVFSLPNKSDHLGCVTGQYIQIKIPSSNGFPEQERYFSPVSNPYKFGEVELVLGYETQGILTKYFKSLDIGDSVDFRGPCGGFEYLSNSVDKLTLLASGGGITPCIQIIRAVMTDSTDKTNINLLYYAENYQDILFKDELDELNASDARLSVVYSIGEATDDWEGENRYLDKDMIKTYVDIITDKTHKLIICGGVAMILSTLYSLKELGFSSDQVFVFGPFGVAQVRKVFGKACKLSSHCLM